MKGKRVAAILVISIWVTGAMGYLLDLVLNIDYPVLYWVLGVITPLPALVFVQEDKEDKNVS